MYLHLCVVHMLSIHVCVSAHVCMHVQAGGVFLSHFLPSFSRQGLSLNLELNDRLLANGSREPCVSVGGGNTPSSSTGESKYNSSGSHSRHFIDLVISSAPCLNIELY